MLEIKGTYITFDLYEAEQLYNELNKIFGAKTPFLTEFKGTPIFTDYANPTWQAPKPSPDWEEYKTKTTCNKNG